MKTKDESKKIVARNRKASYDFTILEQVEAGIVLTGSEVKSLRAGRIELAEAFARVEAGEARLLGASIPKYEDGGYANHDPDRPRRLLLHKRQIRKLAEKTEVERLTIIPLEVYWLRGKAKVLLGVAKGKKTHDKRQAIRERDDRRSIERAYAGRD